MVGLDGTEDHDQMNGRTRIPVEFEDKIMSHAAASTMSARIERTLTHERQDGGQSAICQASILSFRDPVVILGDPGLGKTVLTQWLGERPGMKYVRAGTFVRAANPANSVAGTERIVVDGLDEIASAAPGGAVDAVLKQLSAIGNPPFVLSCRAADWLGAAGPGEDRGRLRRGARAAPSAAVHGRRRARFPLRGVPGDRFRRGAGASGALRDRIPVRESSHVANAR